VARTRAALAQACIELCGVKDFQSLVIAEIARLAGLVIVMIFAPECYKIFDITK
jgi:hypothetical protein